MDQALRTRFDHIRSTDKSEQNAAYEAALLATDQPVDWAYEVWDELLESLTHKDNHVRAIASQVLCNLAKSDPKERILKDLPALIAVTRDERFVTARHCMQSLWKIGMVGPKQQKALVDALSARFADCAAEKNCTLIRYDILQSLRSVYDITHDETIRSTAQSLIATERDPKYQKKYSGLWKK